MIHIDLDSLTHANFPSTLIATDTDEGPSAIMSRLLLLL